MHSSKILIIVTPGSNPESVREIVRGVPRPGPTDLEVLLPPDAGPRYDNLNDRKETGKLSFVASPARSFFSGRHLEWLRGKLQSSENVMVVVRQSPYEDLASAVTSLLIMLLAGKSITLLRTVTPAPGPSLDLEGWNSSERVISKELNWRTLGKQYTHLFPTIWEILYFFMFLGLIVRKSLVKHCTPLSRILK